MTKKTEIEEDVIAVTDFLRKGYTLWYECHWTVAGTIEQAESWFKDKGFKVKKIYKMTYPNRKSSETFFSFWGIPEDAPIEKESLINGKI